MKLNFFQKKRGIVSDYLPWLMIALAVLVILVIAIYFLSEKSFAFIDNIKNIFRK